ncbi:MAG: Zn-ribbon domain-containing OB-fold protein [Actinomycetota bacterium]
MIEVLQPGARGVPPLDSRPLPYADNVSSTYWEAAGRGELLYQECPKCQHRQFYPRAMCTACGSEPEWRQAAGRGIVHTFTVIHQNLAQPFGGWLPYVVAMVELEEGPKMMSNITHCEPADVQIGMPVECYTVAVEEGLGIPFWRPVSASP